MANNFDPLLSQRYTAWIEQLELASPAKLLELLRLMGVGWLVVENDNPPLGIEYEQLETPQRVRLVGNAKWVESEEDALQAIFSEGAELRDTVILLGEPEAPAIVPFVGGDIVILEKENPNNVSIQVSSADQAWLVLSDQWYPGWSVTIDGEEAELLQADYLFRGVRLPPGIHIVEFNYSPSSFNVGGLISLSSILILGLGLWAVRKI